MTPEERQLLSQLFARIRDAGQTPRDREAEDFIARAVQDQPYAPYLMAQTVIVQEEALKQAAARIDALEAELKAKEGSGSFLSGTSKSLFGGGSVPSVGARPAEAGRPNPWGQSPGAPRAPMGQAMQQPFNQGPLQSPFGQQGAGGGFLRTAMATAAGVAGGALLMHGLQSMFGGQAHAQDIQSLAQDPLSAPAATEGGMIPNIFGDDPNLTDAGYGPEEDGFDLGSDESGGDDWV